MASQEPSSFDQFWDCYPRKVAKLAALKAYYRALKIATHEQIVIGVGRYKRNKPEYADWCHPATWLNAGRWMDEDDAIAAIAKSVTVSHAITKLKADRFQEVKARIKTIRDGVSGLSSFTPAELAELKQLKAERDSLSKELGLA